MAATVALVCISSTYAGGEGWISDFEAAKKQAAEEDKNLLIDFTGSDWCGWCIQLKKEVFDLDEFNEGVADKFVLVEIDFPQDDAHLSEETKAQNEILKEEYAIAGYPTIMLTDATGRPFAQTGYQEGGPDAYLEHLDELLGEKETRDVAFALAEDVDGVVKASVLIAALTSLDAVDEELLAKFYADEIAMIKASDPDDVTGYLKNIELNQKFAEFEDKLNELGKAKKFDEALVLVDETLESGGFGGERLQNVLFIKAIIFVETDQFDEALSYLDQAKEAAPESDMARNLPKIKARFIELQDKAAEEAAEAASSEESEAAEAASEE